MSQRRQLNLNLFIYPGGHHEAAWRYKGSAASRALDISYYQQLARTAEHYTFDAIFFADGPALADNVRYAQRFRFEPITWLSAIAAATSRIGLIGTASTTYHEPYNLARLYASLDHLSGGRIGWNIVTGYLDSGARGMGLPNNRAHDDRYDAADEFLAAVYKLWEGSWQPGAVRRDRAAGLFTDSSKVHRVRHDAAHFKVDGIHLAEPSPQRTPLLYQAGTSTRGRAFAARHAEAIFLNGQTRPVLARAVREIREAAKDAGRDPYDIRLFAGATVIVAPTRAEAHDLLADYAAHVDQAGQLALLSGWAGIDFSTYNPDDPIRYVESNAIQSMVENFTVRSERPVRIGDLAALSRAGARSPFVVGSPQDVADELIAWADETDVDGFNLFRLVAPESLEAFVDLVVPELQSRGVYKTAYRDGTLREKLFPGRGPLLHTTHPGAGYRDPATLQSSHHARDAAE